MDDRQSQIKEGAGLEESRVNEEFIAFLNKWSFPVLLVVAVSSLGYFVYNQWQAKKIAARDEAFAQYGSVENSPNPSVYSLTGIAEEFDGIGSVAELALLNAADLRLNIVRTGRDPAAEDPEAQLSDEDIAFNREQARSLYQRVADSVRGDADRALIGVNAAFGLAAVAESAGDTAVAQERYAEAERLANEAGFAPLAKVASQLASTAGDVGSVELFEAAQLPRMPFEPEPEPEPEVVPESDTEPAVDPEDAPADESGSGDTPGDGG